MSIMVCTRCGGPVRVAAVRRSESTVEGVPARYYRCETCGPTDAKAPTIHPAGRTNTEFPTHRSTTDADTSVGSDCVVLPVGGTSTQDRALSGAGEE